MSHALIKKLLKDTNSVVSNKTISDDDFIKLIEWRGELREICSRKETYEKLPVCPVLFKNIPVDN